MNQTFGIRDRKSWKERSITISPRGIFAFLSAVVVILNSGYYRTIASDSYVPLILLIVMAAVSLLVFRTKTGLLDSKLILILVIAVGIGFSILFNFSSANLLSGGRVLVMALCCYILLVRIGKDLFFKHFSRLMRIIIWLSIALWLYMNVFGSLPGRTYGEYADLFVVTAKAVGGRSMGVFWEPGVFASVVIMTMLVEFYYTEGKTSAYRLILYTVGVLLSGSTAGILILLILLVAYLWRRWNFERYRLANFAFVALIALGLSFYETLFQWLYEVNPDVFGKLMETTSETTATRLNAPMANLQIFLQSPVFGHGFTDAATLFTSFMGIEGEWNIVAQTSTGTQMLAAIGICGVAYTLAFFVPLFLGKKSGLGFVSRIAIAAIMLLITNKEPHLHIALTWLLMFLCVSKKEPSINKEEFD